MLSLFDPRVILGLLLFWLISVGGLSWAAYNRGGDDNEAAHVAADLSDTKKVLGDFVQAGKDMNKVAGEFTGVSADLATQINGISGKFRNATRANPLPDSCHPDIMRVQSLSAAIAATNSAAGRIAIPAVPATH